MSALSSSHIFFVERGGLSSRLLFLPEARRLVTIPPERLLQEAHQSCSLALVSLVTMHHTHTHRNPPLIAAPDTARPAALTAALVLASHLINGKQQPQKESPGSQTGLFTTPVTWLRGWRPQSYDFELPDGTMERVLAPAWPHVTKAVKIHG